MRQNFMTLIVLAVSGAILVSSLFYGPMRRSFASQVRVHEVSSLEDINVLWQSTGVRGRTLVIFSRSLSPDHQGTIFSEYIYTSLAIHDGVIRSVYHVVPDAMWPQVVGLQAQCCPDVRPTDYGYFVARREGRIHFLPLSRFSPLKEQVLTILDVPTWSPTELEQIAGLLESKQVTTDILAVSRSTGPVLHKLRSILSK